MKKFFFLFFISAVLSRHGIAQVNLVPNPSFETHDSCPAGPSELNKALPWFQPSWGTPDYLHTCSIYPDVRLPLDYWGFQNAHTGNACAGFFACIIYFDSLLPNYREYSEVRLVSPLQAGMDYYVSFFVSLADSMYFGTDAIGAFFSSDTVRNNTGYFLPLTPQIQNTPGNFLSNQMAWTKVFGKFTAIGGEEFITIGNFNDYLHTDTLAVRQGWTTSIGLSDYSGGYYYLDDICVSTDSIFSQHWTSISETDNNNSISIFPNPSNGKVFLEPMNGKRIEIKIFNLLGIEVKSFNVNDVKSEIDFNENGIYFISISDGLSEITKRIIITK